MLVSINSRLRTTVRWEHLHVNSARMLVENESNLNFMATNKWGVVVPRGHISKSLAKEYRSRGGVAKTMRATRSDKGKRRK